MLTPCGLRQEICDFGSIVEATTAITIENNPTLSEDERLEELRRMRAEIQERLKVEFIKALENGGYFISEEEGGYTQIVFQHSRIVCLGADSFIGAIRSLHRNYCDALPYDILTKVEDFDEHFRGSSHGKDDQPKVSVPSVAYRRLSLGRIIHEHSAT